MIHKWRRSIAIETLQVASVINHEQYYKFTMNTRQISFICINSDHKSWNLFALGNVLRRYGNRSVYTGTGGNVISK